MSAKPQSTTPSEGFNLPPEHREAWVEAAGQVVAEASVQSVNDLLSRGVELEAAMAYTAGFVEVQLAAAAAAEGVDPLEAV